MGAWGDLLRAAAVSGESGVQEQSGVSRKGHRRACPYHTRIPVKNNRNGGLGGGFLGIPVDHSSEHILQFVK